MIGERGHRWRNEHTRQTRLCYSSCCSMVLVMLIFCFCTCKTASARGIWQSVMTRFCAIFLQILVDAISHTFSNYGQLTFRLDFPTYAGQHSQFLRYFMPLSKFQNAHNCLVIPVKFRWRAVE